MADEIRQEIQIDTRNLEAKLQAADRARQDQEAKVTNLSNRVTQLEPKISRARSDIHIIESRLRSVGRQLSRGAIAIGVGEGLEALGLEEGEGAPFGRIIGTGVSSFVFSGGNPAVAALSVLAVSVGEQIRQLKDLYKESIRRAEEAKKEAKETRKRLDERDEQISKALDELRRRGTEAEQRQLGQIRDEAREYLYLASRSVPYEP